MNRSPSHAALTGLVARNGELIIGGKTVSELAAQAGQTPFYVYAKNAMRERVAALRAALPKEIHLHYAIKANPMPAVVQHMAGLVDGLDVASAGELAVALTTPTAPIDISFAGPGKTDAELQKALAAGITINIESANELERLAALAAGTGQRPNIAVRVNPDFELKLSGMRMGGGPKPFGIDAEAVPEVLRRIGELDCRFRGFHIFSGSQNLRAEAIIETQRKTLDLALNLAAQAPREPELINLGGGFGIPYFPGEQPLDIEHTGSVLDESIRPVLDRYPNVELVIELGRYLVGEAGAYICRIVDRKVSRGHVFLVTDGGLHHHLAASGNFGQVLRKNYPVVIANRLDATATENVSVVGPLCTPLDILADKVDLPSAQPGDLVAVLQSGAYGYSASPHRFLSHLPPAEVLV